MTTKLKIDLAEGILEVEGSEAFVKAIYNDFKIHFLGEEAVEEQPKSKRSRRRRTPAKAKAKPKAEPKPKPKPESKAEAKTEAGAEPEPKAATPAPKKAEEPQPPAKPAPEKEEKPEAPAPKSKYKFLDEIDLSAADGRPSLVEFMDNKFPITNEERNLVFLHYLQHVLNLKSITADHIYTCYRAAKIRVPTDLEASLQTTVDQHRWIKITKTGKLSVTPAGKLYVENQLPKKIKS